MLDLAIDRGRNRRHWLRVGALGLGSLTLPAWLRSRADTGHSSKSAVIQVFLAGGPSHLDSYDPKPDAPLEFRGEFRALPTNVPGIALSELLPRQARLMDKLVLVRGLRHTSADHNAGAHWILTGHPSIDPNPRGNDRPSVGSIVARLRGANQQGLPPYVALPKPPAFGQAAYLGAGFNPFSPDTPDARVRDLDPPPGITLERIDDRRALLARLDRVNSRVDRAGNMAGIDRFTADAYAMITGPAASAAFDLSRENERTLERYGRSTLGRSCLLARRLVEAGVTFVTIIDEGWDHHTQVFASCRKQLPSLDAALAALIADIHDRALADHVLLLVWGEFGRTPRVNPNGGRDHWPGAFSALLSGGGLKSGQVIGSTGRKGESPTDHAVGPADVIRTVYSFLGVDPTHEFTNEAGRPMPVLSGGRGIDELD